MFYFHKAHYMAIAAKILEEAASPHYFSGRVELLTALDAEVELTATLIIYRRRPQPLDEAAVDSVSNVVPVWWDVVVRNGEGEPVFDHDFDFEKLRLALLDCEK